MQHELYRRICWNLLTIIVVLSNVGIAWCQSGQPSRTQSSQPEMLSLTDAEILIYLLPEARETRKNGMDIGWEIETQPKLNSADFYNFWVVNKERQGHMGSVTIGYFSVNKHTADIWDRVSDKLINPDEELLGVQRILREGYHIDAQVIARYRDIKLMR